MPKANLLARVAVLELGTNALRLLVVKKNNGGHGGPFGADGAAPLVFKRIPLRLGTDVFQNKKLSSKTITKLCQAIKQLQEIADKYQAKKILVATSAIRESKNKKQIKNEILKTTGLKLNIISGKAEANYALAGIQTKINIAKGSWIVGDLGGGTLQLNSLKNGKLIWNKSLPLGVVRLLHSPLTQSAILRTLSKYALAKHKLIFTGGGMDAVAKMLKIKTKPANIKVKDLISLRAKLSLLSAKQIENKYKLPADRADVIKPGLDVYIAVATATQAKELLIPYAGIREGIAAEMLEK